MICRCSSHAPALLLTSHGMPWSSGRPLTTINEMAGLTSMDVTQLCAYPKFVLLVAVTERKGEYSGKGVKT
eukprot:scaffold42148_cov38-Prasinocladus_malaysianus.AAC.1